MQWEVVIGIETHAQLTSASKIFSGASTRFGSEPNSQASVIDFALPGTLPALNRGAVERAIKFGIATGAEVASRSIFARKNYFYPDLPKGYQISQYETLVIWLDVCDGNMQEGSFRCDANVSVRPAGDTRLGTRCEIKNLNSFRFLERAIEFEVRRQIELMEDGGTVVQETRLYDSERDETRPMRGKEDAMDYRYFPDPDLRPLAIANEWIERVRRTMPELPGAMRERFVREYGLPEYDASVLTASKELAEYFEAAAKVVKDKK